MSSTLSLLLSLTVLIPQAFSAVLPVHHAAAINPVSGNNPQDPNRYKVPGTDIAITVIAPLGPPLPSLPNAIACLTAAQSNISRTAPSPSDLSTLLIPRSGYNFTHLSVAISADPLFPRLGTYGQLSAGLKGLLYLLTTTPPGAREMHWLVEDGKQGTVLKGEVVGVVGGEVSAVGTATVTATGMQKPKGTGTGTAGWRFRELEDGGGGWVGG